MKGKDRDGRKTPASRPMQMPASVLEVLNPSHGSVVVMFRGSVLLWKSARQATVTLSTAEAELNELIEGLMVGESVAAILEELEPKLMKVMISDSQAAVNICLAEGGSWRTRHLRLRAAHAKQRFTKGDWMLRHRPGQEMLADLGTKILPVARFETLKTGLGMQKRKIEEEGDRAPEEKKRKKGDRDPEERKEEEGRSDSMKPAKVPEELVRALQVITMYATLTCGKAMGQEDPSGGAHRVLHILIMAYTLLVAVITLLIRWAWQWVMSRERSEEKKKKDEETRKAERKSEEEEERGEESEEEELSPIAHVRSPAPSMAAGSATVSRIYSESSSTRRRRGGGDPDPQFGGRRRSPPIFVTQTGLKYHLARDCSGLRNARAVYLARWCEECKDLDIVIERIIYSRGASYPIHKRDHTQCDSARPFVGVLRPCAYCVPPRWPDED